MVDFRIFRSMNKKKQFLNQDPVPISMTIFQLLSNLCEYHYRYFTSDSIRI